MEMSNTAFMWSSALMYATAGVLLASVLWSIVQSFFEARGTVFRRLLWLFGPVLGLALGIATFGRAMAATTGRVDGAGAGERVEFVARGLSYAMNGWTAAGLAGGIAAVFAALGLGISTILRVRDVDGTARQSETSALIVSAGGMVLAFVVGSVLWDAAPADYFAAVALGFAGLGHGLVMWAGSAGSEAIEFRTTVAASGMLLVCAVGSAIVTTVGVVSISIFERFNEIPQEEYAPLVSSQLSSHWYGILLYGGPLLLALGIAVVSVPQVDSDGSSGESSSFWGQFALCLILLVAAVGYAAWHYPAFEQLVIETYSGLSDGS